MSRCRDKLRMAVGAIAPCNYLPDGETARFVEWAVQDEQMNALASQLAPQEARAIPPRRAAKVPSRALHSETSTSTRSCHPLSVYDRWGDLVWVTCGTAVM